MQIEMLPVEAVKEYEGNPRVNDPAVGGVASSIREFGFRVPVIVDGDNVLVAGHTRVKAARQLGLTEVPAVRADDLTPEQIRAFRIADNKLHELSNWDLDLLAVELSELQASDVDLESLGFDQDELAKLLDPGVKQGLTDPDEVPEPPDEAITQPGDLWVLPALPDRQAGGQAGRADHRLLGGDSSVAEDVDRLLDGRPVVAHGRGRREATEAARTHDARGHVQQAQSQGRRSRRASGCVAGQRRGGPRRVGRYPSFDGGLRCPDSASRRIDLADTRL